MCNLYHMHTKVLGGFYQSEILVAAHNMADAISNAMHTYDKWVEQSIEEYGYHPTVTSVWPDDEDYKMAASAARSEFRAELNTSLKQTTRRGLILHSI